MLDRKYGEFESLAEKAAKYITKRDRLLFRHDEDYAKQIRSLCGDLSYPENSFTSRLLVARQDTDGSWLVFSGASVDVVSYLTRIRVAPDNRLQMAENVVGDDHFFFYNSLMDLGLDRKGLDRKGLTDFRGDFLAHQGINTVISKRLQYQLLEKQAKSLGIDPKMLEISYKAGRIDVFIATCREYPESMEHASLAVGFSNLDFNSVSSDAKKLGLWPRMGVASIAARAIFQKGQGLPLRQGFFLEKFSRDIRLAYN